MKRLIFINGTMGVGKTTVGNELLNILQPSVFLDGDWCWNMKPFIVNDETKEMVLANIVYLLRKFLTCSEYDNVIFTWVMPEESIIDNILAGLSDLHFERFIFTLTASEKALVERLSKDIERKIRTTDIIESSLEKQKMYQQMKTTKIDVSDLTPKQTAEKILGLLLLKSKLGLIAGQPLLNKKDI